MRILFAFFFSFLLTISGLLINFATPPLMSPDEADHLKRAYTLTTGEWTMHNPGRGVSTSALIDSSLANFIRLHWARNMVQSGAWSAPPTGPEAQASLAVLEKSSTHSKVEIILQSKIGGPEKPISMPAPGAALYPPSAYLPQGVALGFARTFHLPALLTYKLVRLLSLLSSTFILFVAFLVNTPGPLEVALLTLPMFLFQLSSPTLDGFSISLSILAISLFLAMPRVKQNTKYRMFFGLLISVLLVVPARLHLWGLLLLPLFRSCSLQRSWTWFTSLMPWGAVMIWVMHVSSNTVDLRGSSDKSDLSQTALLLLGDPSHIASLVWQTVTNREILLNLGHQFVGVLGWLNLPLESQTSYQLMAILLGLSMLLGILLAREQLMQLVDADRLLLICLCLVSCLSVFIIMMIYWTPNPSQATEIAGPQGRYFLVPALMLAFAIAPSQERLQSRTGMLISYGTGVISLFIGTQLTLQALS